MKTAISIPDDLFSAIDKLSKELNCSRSRILTNAAREYIKKLENKSILEAINKAYSEKETEQEATLTQVRQVIIICLLVSNSCNFNPSIIGTTSLSFNR